MITYTSQQDTKVYRSIIYNRLLAFQANQHLSSHARFFLPRLVHIALQRSNMYPGLIITCGYYYFMFSGYYYFLLSEKNEGK